MKFYDFMTLFWAALWGAAMGIFTYALAASDPARAWGYGAIATAGTAALVWVIRELRNPH